MHCQSIDAWCSEQDLTLTHAQQQQRRCKGAGWNINNDEAATAKKF